MKIVLVADGFWQRRKYLTSYIEYIIAHLNVYRKCAISDFTLKKQTVPFEERFAFALIYNLPYKPVFFLYASADWNGEQFLYSALYARFDGF